MSMDFVGCKNKKKSRTKLCVKLIEHYIYFLNPFFRCLVQTFSGFTFFIRLGMDIEKFNKIGKRRRKKKISLSVFYHVCSHFSSMQNNKQFAHRIMKLKCRNYLQRLKLCSNLININDNLQIEFNLSPNTIQCYMPGNNLKLCPIVFSVQLQIMFDIQVEQLIQCAYTRQRR